MTEKLIIKNFAGIKEIELEVRAINILIGPQASGKSVCAKLLFYFKNSVWKIASVIENEQTQDDLDSGYCRTFKEYFPDSVSEDLAIEFDQLLDLRKFYNSSTGFQPLTGWNPVLLKPVLL